MTANVTYQPISVEYGDQIEIDGETLTVFREGEPIAIRKLSAPERWSGRFRYVGSSSEVLKWISPGHWIIKSS